MNRQTALQYLDSAVLDDSLNVQTHAALRDDARLIGWQCGFEPHFIAVQSYLPGVRLDDDEAAEIAVDYLKECEWFADCDAENEPDYII